jgi:hypothetical protein
MHKSIKKKQWSLRKDQLYMKTHQSTYVTDSINSSYNKHSLKILLSAPSVHKYFMFQELSTEIEIKLY